jgi:hypothetical protein
LEVPTTGTYGIGIDGDDAVEVIIDGVLITGWYGGHGWAGSAQFTVNVSLDARAIIQLNFVMKKLVEVIIIISIGDLLV